MLMHRMAGWQGHVHPTDDGHRVTELELFFDLVFVYGLTQVTALMAARNSWTGALEGLIVLALLWFAWSAFAWLGNQAKADEGVLRLALVLAMTAVFVVALAIPNAFEDRDGLVDAAPLALAVGLVAARLVHLGVYFIAAGDDAGLRRQLLLTTVPVGGWAVLLLAGAFVDGGARLALWFLALVVDYVGIFVSSKGEGWRLYAAGHFAERHGLIVIIAIGESIVSIGVGTSDVELSGVLLLAVLLGIAISVTLWWSYFDVVAPVAERVLAERQGDARAKLARDSYTYLHFPMVVGIVFLALGMKKVVGYVADPVGHDVSDPLTGVPLVALYGGVALYLLAHIAFRLRNLHSVNRQRLAVALLLLLLMPLAWQLPAIVALGLVAALMVGLIVLEATRFAESRDAVRHADGR
jgi:low temperature requirement protein LtrA